MADYLPIDGKPLRVTMGTRPLDPVDWIEIDDSRVGEMDEKDRLLAERPDDVLAHLPEGQHGSQELLDLLLRHLPDRFPDVYGVIEGGVRDLQRERDVPAHSGHPVDVAGRLVQEDLCVMTRDGGTGWRLTAASVCFPSRWRLADKIGRDLAAIHEPVPFYAERVGAPVDRFLERLEADRPAWRLNWTLLDDPALFQPRAGKAWRERSAGEDVDLGDLLHFRVERQTLRLLPESGDVAFTIRTYVRPLRDLEAMRTGAFGQLADTLASTARETSSYKGWTPLLDETVEWLRARVSR